jgi:hypothetical protein
MSENDRLADELVVELSRALLAYLTNQWTGEQFIVRLQAIFRASNL